jgi:hypothetical protein
MHELVGEPPGDPEQPTGVLDGDCQRLVLVLVAHNPGPTLPPGPRCRFHLANRFRSVGTNSGSNSGTSLW